MSTYKHSFNNSIYTAVPNANSVSFNTGTGGTVTIPSDFDLDGTITTSTITASTAAPTITLSSDWDDLATDSSITIGDFEITEDIVRDLMIMLEVIKQLDDSNPIKDMFNTIKMLDTIKGKKNLDLPK
jgi:hypothetical protein